MAQDKEVLDQAQLLFEADKILQADRLLQSLDNVHWTDTHRKIQAVAQASERAILDVLQFDPASWTKQGESHGRYDTTIHYKLEDGKRLVCLVETPIDTSLLVPLLCVLNESELYVDWIPSWEIPKLGVHETELVEKRSRVNQTIRILANVPWPFSQRETVLTTTIIDEIDENSYFAVRIDTVENKSPSSKAEQIEVHGLLLFRPQVDCPDQVHVSFKLYVPNQTKVISHATQLV